MNQIKLVVILSIVVAVLLVAAIGLSISVVNRSTADEPVADTQPSQDTTPSYGDEVMENDPISETTENTMNIPTEPPTDKDVLIDTPYGMLRYPGTWSDFLRTEIEQSTPYVVSFYAKLESGKSQELFKISFDGNMDEAIATIKANGKVVPVAVESVNFAPDADWSEQEINIVYNMQEALNSVLGNLPITLIGQNPQDSGPALPPDTGEDMTIDTPYMQLYFPLRWKEYLSIKSSSESGYSVSFFTKFSGHDELELFSIYFGTNQGILLGTVDDKSGNDVNITIDIIPIELDSSWSDTDRSIVYAMQEDVNYLLSQMQ